MTVTLNVIKRELTEKNDAIRSEGFVPAVFYGSGSDAQAIKIAENELIRVYRQAGASSVIDFAGALAGEQAIIHDLQTEPKSGKILHIDFLRIQAGKPVEVTVPLEFVGKAPAESQGIVVKVMHEITMEVLPSEMPSEITIDISSLVDLSSAIYIKDIKLPASAKVLHSENDAVVTVTAIKEETEESGEIDFDSIQVQEKGKKEAEDEE